MRNDLFCSVFSLALGLLGVSQAFGQAFKPADQTQSGSAHRMVIYNGSTRTVSVFAPGASTAEQSALRDVERTAAETAQAADLVNELRQARLETARADVARAEFERSQYGFRLPYPVVPNSFELLQTAATPFLDRELLPFLPRYAGLWGFPFGSFLGAPGLAWAGPWPNAVPEQGTRVALKDITQELATAEADLARRTRQHDAAVARAASTSDRIREAVGAPASGGVKPAALGASGGEAFQPGSHVSITRKAGGTVDGALISEDANWIVVRTGDGVHKIPMSNVTEIVEKPDTK
jgi:hypothetical protein